MVDKLPDARVAVELLEYFFFTLKTGSGRTFEHDISACCATACVFSG